MKSKFENLLGAAGMALALSSTAPNVEAQEPPKNTAEQKCEKGVRLIQDETGGLALKVTWDCPDAGTVQPTATVSAQPAPTVSAKPAPTVSVKPAVSVSPVTENVPPSKEKSPEASDNRTVKKVVVFSALGALVAAAAMFLKKEFDRYQEEKKAHEEKQKRHSDSAAGAKQSTQEPVRPAPQRSPEELLAQKRKWEEEARIYKEKQNALRAQERAVWQKNIDQILLGDNLEKLVRKHLADTHQNSYPGQGLSYYKPSEDDLLELISLTRDMLSDPRFEAAYYGPGKENGMKEWSLTPMYEGVRDCAKHSKVSSNYDDYPQLSYGYLGNADTVKIVYRLGGQDYFSRITEMSMGLEMGRETAEKVLDAIRKKPLMVMGGLRQILLLVHRTGDRRDAGWNDVDLFSVPKWGESSDFCKFIK